MSKHFCKACPIARNFDSSRDGSSDGEDRFGSSSPKSGKTHPFHDDPSNRDQKFSVARHPDTRSSTADTTSTTSTRSIESLPTSSDSVTIMDSVVPSFSSSAFANTADPSAASPRPTLLDSTPSVSSTVSRSASSSSVALNSMAAMPSSIPVRPETGTSSASRRTVAIVVASLATGVILLAVCVVIAWRRRRRKAKENLAVDPFVDLEAPQLEAHPNPETESARRIRKATLDRDLLRRDVRVSTVARSITAGTNGSQSSRSSISASSQVHEAFSLHEAEVQPSRWLHRAFGSGNVIVTGSNLSTLPPPYDQSMSADRYTG